MNLLEILSSSILAFMVLWALVFSYMNYKNNKDNK
jgi:hypothetical protein